MGMLREARWYDRAFMGSAEQRGPAQQASWFPLWAHVLSHIPPGRRVLDLGCGSGQLASMLYESKWGGSYTGIDFSPARVAAAQERCPEGQFEVQDLRLLSAESLAQREPHVIVLTEVLEHLENDLELLSRLPSGVLLILSVPTRDSASHVRFFPTLAEAEARYAASFHTVHAASLKTWHVLRGIT